MRHIDTNSLTAVFGLVGVIIGGAITAFTTYWIERQRALRDERKEQRKRLIEVKRAARLIDEDFKWAWAAVSLAIEDKRWPTVGHDPVRLEAWQEHRGLLASETTLGDWRVLQAAVRAMESYKSARNEAIGRGAWEIDEKRLGYRQTEKTAIQKGREVLKPFVAD